MILNFISRNKCCGCGACVEICPKKALTMEEDEEGFLRPVLNMDFCIDCGGCDNVCPMKSENLVKHEIQASYAAINQNRGILKKSSSGGVFSVIAEYVILKSATTRLYDTEAKIICIVSKKGAQCIECHHKDI